MTDIVMPNGTIASANVVGDLPSRDDRAFWILSGSSIVVDAAAKLAAKRATMTISFGQLIVGLVIEGWITEIEGDAWLRGTVLPSDATTLIAALPSDQRFAATVRAMRPSIVLRTDPLVIALATADSRTPEELDAFFTTYAEI